MMKILNVRFISAAYRGNRPDPSLILDFEGDYHIEIELHEDAGRMADSLQSACCDIRRLIREKQYALESANQWIMVKKTIEMFPHAFEVGCTSDSASMHFNYANDTKYGRSEVYLMFIRAVADGLLIQRADYMSGYILYQIIEPKEPENGSA